mmetsp:Transcript_39583/g.77382  ORF Transcript_39583/g.77382 Transcript_39583/m.77382 type:complete len:238 (+) Transcript_39583:286-999(+)
MWRGPRCGWRRGGWRGSCEGAAEAVGWRMIRIGNGASRGTWIFWGRPALRNIHTIPGTPSCACRTATRTTNALWMTRSRWTPRARPSGLSRSPAGRRSCGSRSNISAGLCLPWCGGGIGLLVGLPPRSMLHPKAMCGNLFFSPAFSLLCGQYCFLLLLGREGVGRVSDGETAHVDIIFVLDGGKGKVSLSCSPLFSYVPTHPVVGTFGPIDGWGGEEGCDLAATTWHTTTMHICMTL